MKQQGFETLGGGTSDYRVFTIVAKLRERTWITRLQAYSFEQALKKFHETQQHMPFANMASVVIIQESADPKWRTSGGDKR